MKLFTSLKPANSQHNGFLETHGLGHSMCMKKKKISKSKKLSKINDKT